MNTSRGKVGESLYERVHERGRDHVREHVRIIWAITVKDIGDAIQNKAILSTTLAMLFLAVFLKVMPSLATGVRSPKLAVYDAGSSSLMAGLEGNGQFRLQEMSSQQEMEYYLGLMNDEVLGLVLPPDADQAAQTGGRLELDGYVDHWVSESAIREMKTFFEGQLTELAGRPVYINVTSGTVYTHLEGVHPFTTSVTLTILITVLGVFVAPTLMLEEKRTKTLDALLVSPASAGQVAVGKAMAGLFYCLTGSAVVLTFSAALVVHWDVAVLATICGALFAVALGLLLGSILEVPHQLKIWVIVLTQPFIIAVVLPPELLPDNIETVLSVIPPVALAKAFRVALSASAALAEFGPGLVYVVGCAMLVLAVVAWRIRRTDR